MFQTIIFVGVGSFVGGVLRYLVYLGTEALGWSSVWATFAVNMVGCLLLGFISGVVSGGFNLGENMRLMLTVGVCGGFTTFSTFVNDGFKMIAAGDIGSMALYVGASLLLGLGMVYLGYWLGLIIQN